ncbi:thioredoxin family protein [Halioxenophilus sp. WMMB6]|uniref:thioredoxin family protein n=1 Tax=Halioxenophilus sp. WMMB6 TaxID=3073815 RepID=UPI00295EB6FE|nr:thioredoxin family protein [Halioxenophilus sp. WMMB6]
MPLIDTVSPSLSPPFVARLLSPQAGCQKGRCARVAVIVFVLCCWLAGGVAAATQAESMAGQEHPSSTQAIAWYPGSTKAAFAEAKAANKPLFLYWGAVWCPPCEEIKQTVFISPEFIALSKLFVPVYLDGDTESAQTWGERFGVRGYPTMIVFNPAGEEVTRIPGGINLARYTEVLGSSLANLRSIESLIVWALSEPERLRAADYNQIAYYSWWQENLHLQDDITSAELAQLAASALQAGNTMAGHRLQLTALIFRYMEEQSLSAEERALAYQQLSGLLADTGEVRNNLDLFSYWSEELVTLVTEPGAERERLVDLWQMALRPFRHDPAIVTAEQLATWYSELYLFWMIHPEAEALPEAVEAELLADIDAADQHTRGSARQAVINKAYQLLKAAKRYEAARSLLLAELDKSAEPYYFMSGLAGIEVALGNKHAAVEWYQKAYATAQGPATRFQWGVNYINNAIDLEPEEVAQINGALAGLLAELPKASDVFTGRNYVRLQRLLAALAQWPGRNKNGVVDQFIADLQAACKQTGPDTIAASNCHSLPALTVGQGLKG